MPGRRWALILATAAWSAACSAPPISSLATPAPPPSGLSDRVTSLNVCITDQPETWTTGFQSHSFVLPDGMRFGLGAPTLAGRLAFGQFGSSAGSGIGSVDLSTGRMTPIVTYEPGASGMGWMAVELPWVVWEQGNSQTNPADWSLLAWNRESGERLTLATSRLADGSFLSGQSPLPAIRRGTVTWAQPLPKRADYNEAQIHVFDLSRKRDTAIASGRVGVPVFAGGYLVWGRRDAEGRYSFQAVDADTLQHADLPPRLRDPGPIVYTAGSPRYLAWSGEGSRSLVVWPIDSQGYREYRAPDLGHTFQFIQLAGDYVLFYGGASSTVLDLGSGRGFDVSGSLAGSEQTIAKEEASAPAQKGTAVSSRLSSVPLTAVGPVGPCPR